MKKKAMALMLTAMLAASSLAGCGSDPASTGSSGEGAGGGRLRPG